MPAGDITQGYIFAPGEKAIDQVKMNAIVGSAYINPAFISGQTGSSSTSTGDYFLLLKSGGTLAKILYDDLASSLAAATGFQSQIWATRLRTFNAAGNQNFEVDQRQCGTAPTIGAALFSAGSDRWSCQKAGGTTMAATAGVFGTGATTPVLVPGTSFGITQKALRIQLTAAQASLAAGDLLWINQQIEGPLVRELISDVTSISVLARTSGPSISVGVGLRDPGSPTKSLVKLCTIPSGAWTLVTFPNIPVFPVGNFVTTLGSIGLQINICLAAGSTWMAPANDMWQSGNLLGAVGQTNFASLAVNTWIDFAFIQLEPGAICTTLMDLDFDTNLSRCQRYFDKSYQYGVKPGAVDSTGAINLINNANTSPIGPIRFKRTMAKVPTVTGYSVTTGAINTVRDASNSVDRAITAVSILGDAGFGGFPVTGAPASVWQSQFHYTADTGW